MKLAELGLKTKPETKYVAGGYISFFTEDKHLGYKIYKVSKTNQALLDGGSINSKDQLTELLTLKSISDAVKRVYQ